MRTIHHLTEKEIQNIKDFYSKYYNENSNYSNKKIVKKLCSEYGFRIEETINILKNLYPDFKTPINIEVDNRTKKLASFIAKEYTLGTKKSLSLAKNFERYLKEMKQKKYTKFDISDLDKYAEEMINYYE